jgi:hypothetical protein
MRKPRRVILKVELTPEAAQAIDHHIDKFGLTKAAAMSRLILWACSLDDLSQAALLGQLPAGAGVDVAQEWLESLRGK